MSDKKYAIIVPLTQSVVFLSENKPELTITF